MWQLNKIEIAVFSSILKIEKKTNTFFPVVRQSYKPILALILEFEQYFKISPVKSSARKLNKIELAVFSSILKIENKLIPFSSYKTSYKPILALILEFEFFLQI